MGWVRGFWNSGNIPFLDLDKCYLTILSKVHRAVALMIYAYSVITFHFSTKVMGDASQVKCLICNQKYQSLDLQKSHKARCMWSACNFSRGKDRVMESSD